jgi:hypothetical protein
MEAQGYAEGIDKERERKIFFYQNCGCVAIYP